MKELIFIYYRNYKKRLPQFLILTILILFIMMITIIFNYNNHVYTKNIVNSLNNRELVAIGNDNVEDIENILKEIKKINHIKDVYIKYPVVSLTNELEERFEFIYRSKYEIKIENMKNIENLLENEIIVPSEFWNNYENTEKLLNFKSEKGNYYFKVFGVYSSSENKENQIFVSENLMKNILKQEEISIPKKTFTIIIDDFENLESVASSLENKGYSVNLNDSSGLLKINAYKELLNILQIIIIVLLIISFFIIFIILKNMIMTENKDISILKVCGYKKIQILKILFFRVLILIFLVLCTILILYNFIYIFTIISQIKVSFFEFYKLHYWLNLKSISINFLIIFVIVVISCLVVSKQIHKISLMLLFKE